MGSFEYISIHIYIYNIYIYIIYILSTTDLTVSIGNWRQVEKYFQQKLGLQSMISFLHWLVFVIIVYFEWVQPCSAPGSKMGRVIQKMLRGVISVAVQDRPCWP